LTEEDEDLEASPGGVEDKIARRAIHTMRGRQEALETSIARVQDTVRDVHTEMRVGFSLLGYDVAAAARARALDPNGLLPGVVGPMRAPAGSQPALEHPALEKLDDAAEKLADAGERLFDFAEAHTRPEAPAALRDSERVRRAEAERIGKRVLKVWDGLLVEIVKGIVLISAGGLVHYVWQILHAAR